MDRKKILVVDDEPEILKLLRLALADYAIDTAMNTEAALSLLSRDRYDLLITDIKMPGPSGFVLINRMQELHEGIPVIVITGHRFEEAAHDLAVPVHHWLNKPFSLQVLREAVANALAG